MTTTTFSVGAGQVSLTCVILDQIKIKSEALPAHYTRTGLAFSDGTEIAADLIVFCTGFVGNAKTDVVQIFGKDVASKIEDYWGLNDEGEIRGAFKPSGRKFFFTVLLVLLHCMPKSNSCGSNRYSIMVYWWYDWPC